MDFVDSEVLIPLIESRPALYDKNLKEYRDVNVKEKLWVEICEIMVKEWGELSPAEKAQIGAKIQKRWQSLRTSFKREYNAQNTTPNTTLGQGRKKRRKYEYYDQLIFLLPTLSDKSTTSNVSQVDDKLISVFSLAENIVEINCDSVATVCSNDSQMDDKLAENIVYSIDSDSVATVSTPPLINTPRTSDRPSIVKSKSKKTSSYEERLLQLFEEKKKESEEIDEDKNFLLSLVPSFKRMNNSQKIRIKMQFLQIIGDVETQQLPVLSVPGSVRRCRLRRGKRSRRPPH